MRDLKKVGSGKKQLRADEVVKQLNEKSVSAL